MAGTVLQAAVIGSSTLLGKELLEEISNSAAAAWELTLLEEGDEVEGRLTATGDEARVVHALEESALSGMDVIFFADSLEVTSKYVGAAVQAGATVIDLSGFAKDQPGFLIRSPWIESTERPDLTTAGVVVPHPAALMLTTVAERLQRRFGQVHLAATVLEPASQAGSAGVDELHQQTVSLLSFQDVPKEIFGSQVAFNLQGSLGEDGRVHLDRVRRRIREDITRLTGVSDGESISLTVLQAPVFHGYVISVYARFASEINEQELQRVLNGGVTTADPEVLPSNQAAVESGDVLVRLDMDTAQARGGWLLLAADNLRLTCRSAVASALELVAFRPGSRVQ